jgi:3-oxoacyl-[acyl-carrier-protein] synthase I
MIDKHGEPMIVARASWLDEDLSVQDRVVSLAIGAAQEALLPIQGEIAAFRRQLHTHLAFSTDSLPDHSLRALVARQFAAGTGLDIDDCPINVYVEGHAGGILALEKACQELHSGKARFCLVGGLDSLMAPERLEAIDLGGRLHSTDQNWGFTPGEGAGFCLLATGSTVREIELVPLAQVFGVATARETNLLGTDTVCTGEGLTAAFRGVLDPTHRVSHCYCDLNGEPYRANEYGFTICRTSQHFKDPANFTAAAECWGDVGAASAVLALTLPLAAWSRGYARGPVALVWASSAHAPLRGAALIGQSISGQG